MRLHSWAPNCGIRFYLSYDQSIGHHQHSVYEKIAERAEFCCLLLTQLNQDSCIDVHHEIFKDTHLVSYGRGYPRPVYVGSSPRIFMAHLPKAKILDYYQRFSAELGQVNFAKDEDDFLKQMRKIKKQGYYFSNGDLDADIASLSVPIHFSSKDAPYALLLLASKNRFEFINLQKLIEILQDNAQQIEKQVETLNADLSLDVNSTLRGKI